MGWCDFYSGGANGVVVHEHILSGYVWGENSGWCCVGEG